MLTQLKAFFKLLRWFHEVVVILPFAGLFFVIRYEAQKNGIVCDLPLSDFVAICVGVQLLIAAGCVLNDIMDRHIDKINKPKTHIVGNTISLNRAKLIFVILTGLIIVLSIYISLSIFVEWAFISIGVYSLSILYDVYFKRSPLMGNVLMALLTAFIPLVLFFFAKECIAALNNEKINILIYLYAALPFLIIIPRELSLDISDMEGDRADGCRTLPIVIGIKKSRMVVICFLLLIIVLSLPVMLKFYHLIIPLSVVDVLLVVYLYKFRSAETRLQYIRIGRFLWFVMILGLVGFTVSTVVGF